MKKYFIIDYIIMALVIIMAIGITSSFFFVHTAPVLAHVLMYCGVGGFLGILMAWVIHDMIDERREKKGK